MTKRLISCLLCLCTLIGFAAVAYADDPVEVVFWNGYTGSDQPTLEAIVETYNNSQDKVRIKMEIMPWDTLYQKLMPAFIAGNAPDLIGFSVTRYMEYAMAGKLEPLDAFIASSETITMDNLVQGLFKAGNYDGKQYTLPMACAAMVMYYNKDMFREAGLDAENPPATMEELYAAWDKLIQKDGNGNVTQRAEPYSRPLRYFFFSLSLIKMNRRKPAPSSSPMHKSYSSKLGRGDANDAERLSIRLSSLCAASVPSASRHACPIFVA